MDKFIQSHTPATDGSEIWNTQKATNGGNEEM
jgi:hypothetical protein